MISLKAIKESGFAGDYIPDIQQNILNNEEFAKTPTLQKEAINIWGKIRSVVRNGMDYPALSLSDIIEVLEVAKEGQESLSNFYFKLISNLSWSERLKLLEESIYDLYDINAKVAMQLQCLRILARVAVDVLPIVLSVL
jgi:hypothetical protein